MTASGTPGDELIPLPAGSRLFTVPGTPPMGFDRRNPPIGDRRSPAAGVGRGANPGGFGLFDARLYPHPAAGGRLRPQEGPAAAVVLHRRRLVRRGGALLRGGGAGRPQHASGCPTISTIASSIRWCADPARRPRTTASSSSWRAVPLDYHCFAAKNLFFRRWEAPLPTSPACNSRCLGCISLQEAPDCCPSSQERLTFVPTVEEICQVAVPHLRQAPKTPSSPSARGARGIRSCRADTICRGRPRDAPGDQPRAPSISTPTPRSPRRSTGWPPPASIRSASRSTRRRSASTTPTTGLAGYPFPMFWSRCAGPKRRGSSPCSTTWSFRGSPIATMRSRRWFGWWRRPAST